MIAIFKKKIANYLAINCLYPLILKMRTKPYLEWLQYINDFDRFT